jgi:hypothetical protein
VQVGLAMKRSGVGICPCGSAAEVPTEALQKVATFAHVGFGFVGVGMRYALTDQPAFT